MLTVGESSNVSITNTYTKDVDEIPQIDDNKPTGQGPNTGDTSNLALWIALLFVSTGAVVGTTVLRRKRKNNR